MTPGGAIGAEYFSLAPAPTSPRCSQGLDDDSCQAPHWGYIIAGNVVVTYDDG